MDRTVGPCRLQCCRMVVTIYHGLTKLFPPIGQHHHLTIAYTIVPIIRGQMSLTPMDQGPVVELVGIEGGVVSGVFNLESSGVEAPDRRPRHEEHYHEA